MNKFTVCFSRLDFKHYCCQVFHIQFNQFSHELSQRHSCMFLISSSKVVLSVLSKHPLCGYNLRKHITLQECDFFFSIFCYFTLSLHCILEADFVVFTPLHSFDNFTYKLLFWMHLSQNSAFINERILSTVRMKKNTVLEKCLPSRTPRLPLPIQIKFVWLK